METRVGNLEGLMESEPKVEGTRTSSKLESPKNVEVEVPDPDEDDLDDLDGKLNFGNLILCKY